jgi:(E)-4-hydroxy-3-methylbut-2-enyl-diphosphate synthase
MDMNPGKKRKVTRQILVGQVPIGGGAPIAVQSMTKTDTRNVEATVDQICRLDRAGCEIVRLAVVDQEAVEAFRRIKTRVTTPLIADVHFDPRLAMGVLRAGADGLRINPGNIGGSKPLRSIAREAGERGVPIRIGVNAGSLQKDILSRYGHPSPEAMVESAITHVNLLEDTGFEQIKISLKSSSVTSTIQAYELLSQRVDYPLHLGVTEAGTLISGTVKSAIGIGYLLLQGIGDTFRVSLTRDPVDEVKVAYEILRAVGLRQRGPEIISCPTCGRCEIDLLNLVDQVEKALSDTTESPKVAVMGCVVNGPGEAREADVGIAGGRGQGILFKRGEAIRKIPEGQLAETLVDEVKKIIRQP